MTSGKKKERNFIRSGTARPKAGVTSWAGFSPLTYSLKANSRGIQSGSGVNVPRTLAHKCEQELSKIFMNFCSFMSIFCIFFACSHLLTNFRNCCKKKAMEMEKRIIHFDYFVIMWASYIFFRFCAHLWAFFWWSACSQINWASVSKCEQVGSNRPGR